MVHIILESFICPLTASNQATAAWNSIFRQLNKAHGVGDIAYREGPF
jgi:hypothetical protein